MEAVRNYMVDYLENVCRHKYEKTNQKEIKILAQEGTAADFTSMPADDQENIRARRMGGRVRRLPARYMRTGRRKKLSRFLRQRPGNRTKRSMLRGSVNQ